MIRYPSRAEIAVATLASIAGVAGSYTVAGYTRSFVVAPIDAFIVRTTPGLLVAWVIENVGAQGHLLHIALSFLIATALLAGTAMVGTHAGRRFKQPALGIGLAGVVAWGLTALVTTEPLLAIAAAAPVMVVTAIGTSPISHREHDSSRRRVLGSAAGTLAFLGLAIGVGPLTTNNATTRGDARPLADGVAPLMKEAEEKSLDIHGDIPGLVSTFDEFYNVDIAEFDPDVSSSDWLLTITGEVDNDVTVTFDELTDRPTEHRFVTLRCVGERLNGKKLDNAVWTGTPIKPILEQVDPDGKCGCAMLRAADGYFVQFPVKALEDGFLAWGMNGQSLPRSHGHPVRVLIPGHWGETNIKWLTEIELLDEEMDGYWEQRGWHGTGPVNTVAKLWSDSTLDNGNVEVAGHAYAGTRGIQRVEVSTDGGNTWQDAELSEPLFGDDVWRQWRYEFESADSHEVVVRAIDGEGTLQPEDQTPPFPRGSTGWVTKTVGG